MFRLELNFDNFLVTAILSPLEKLLTIYGISNSHTGTL